MPDSDRAATGTIDQLPFAAIIIKRLDAIDGKLAAILATDCERRLFPLIAIHTAGSVFTTSDLYLHAQLIPELHGALLETCGPTEGPRRLGKLLERWQNKAVAGVEIERVKVESGGVLWICRFTATAPVAAEVPTVEDAN